MSATESVSITTNQPNLSKQDLSKLDVTKLTALSPEVISRQATINIGTIGHVAHGKSTVVKAVSGVQTVRFKNELERNITIKLDTTDAMVKVAETAPMNANKRLVQQTTASEGKSVGVVRMKQNGIYFTSTSHKDKMSNNFANGINNKNSTITDWIKKTQAPVKIQIESSWPQPPPVKKCKKEIMNKSHEEKSSGSNDNDVYEVEKILDYKNIDNKPMYFVKWKGWASKHNTWEPYEHLEGCTKLLCKFFEKSPDRKRDNVEEELERLRDELSALTVKEVDCLLNRYRKKDGWLKLPTNINCKDTEILLRGLAKRRAADRDPEVFKRVRQELKILALLDKRKNQLEALQDWEDEMNTVSLDSAPLKVENYYDLEGPPQNFMYINDYIPGENVEIPEEPPYGCDCVNNCDRDKVNCCGRSGGLFPYNHFKKLRVALGTPIYECNKRCKCGPDCLNRVVQNGRRVKLCIFKTNTRCGWGVKSLEKVKKGTFITIYVGEVITSEEAERRGKIYDEEGRTYLFDLDYNEKDKFPYTVDAAVLGNVSHFINHSCDPNLEVFAVWINCLDPNLPKLAMFACKDINVGDEITFDYLCHSLSTNNTESSVMDSDLPNLDDNSNCDATRTLCRCGSKNCRKFLF